jgi:hypothetical protein
LLELLALAHGLYAVAFFWLGETFPHSFWRCVQA